MCRFYAATANVSIQHKIYRYFHATTSIKSDADWVLIESTALAVLLITLSTSPFFGLSPGLLLRTTTTTQKSCRIGPSTSPAPKTLVAKPDYTQRHMRIARHTTFSISSSSSNHHIHSKLMSIMYRHYHPSPSHSLAFPLTHIHASPDPRHS